MTIHEAIDQLKSLLDHCKTMRESGEIWARDCEALRIALAALRPVSREQVEKVWRGEWQDTREAYNDVPKRRCSRCKSVFIGLDTPFCEVCGAPMTDEAVQMVMERLEELSNGKG